MTFPVDNLDTVMNVSTVLNNMVKTTLTGSTKELSALSLLYDTNNYLSVLLAHSDSFWDGDELKQKQHVDVLETRYPQVLRNQLIRDSMDAVQVLADSKNHYIRDLAGRVVRGDNWAAVRLYDAQIRAERF